MKYILALFIFASIIHLIIVFNLPLFIPNAHFPYEDLLYKYFRLYPFTPFANFDGYQYISIAKIGYGQFQQGYFPLYPLLIFLLSSTIVKSYLLSGILISNLCFFGGLIYFKLYVDTLFKNKSKTAWAMLFLVAFPTAFYFQVVYTDGLFLFLSAASLYYLATKKYLLASVLAFFVSLTKIQGVLLFIPFLLMIFKIQPYHIRHFSLQKLPVFVKKNFKLFLFSLSPFYGLLAYILYLLYYYHDPLYFYHAQTAFGANRSSDKLILLPQILYRYIKIFITAQHTFSYWISWLEFVVFVTVACVLILDLYYLIKQKIKDMPQISLNLYSLAAMILPTLTGTLSSYPRYALISLGFFTALAKIKSKLVKILLFTIFSLLQIILFIYFLKGYFVS